MVGNAATIRYSTQCIQQESMGDEGRAHSGVSDCAILHGNIEINAYEDALALEVKVCDREFI
jgi:hypothetical protein